MKRKLLIGVGVIIIGAFWFSATRKNELPMDDSRQIITMQLEELAIEVEGKTVKLETGVAESEVAPDSAVKIVTRYFGNTATGDLNGDGLSDTAFLISQDPGGTAIFYYAVVALGTPSGEFKATNAFRIGDRIAPQSTEINESARELHVNFAERKLGEPMTAQPSVGSVLLLRVTPEGRLVGLME